MSCPDCCPVQPRLSSSLRSSLPFLSLQHIAGCGYHFRARFVSLLLCLRANRRVSKRPKRKVYVICPCCSGIPCSMPTTLLPSCDAEGLSFLSWPCRGPTAMRLRPDFWSERLLFLASFLDSVVYSFANGSTLSDSTPADIVAFLVSTGLVTIRSFHVAILHCVEFARSLIYSFTCGPGLHRIYSSTSLGYTASRLYI